MNHSSVIPIWVYFAVAALIAGLAFTIGQFARGMGVPFVAITSTMWVALSFSYQRKARNDNG